MKVTSVPYKIENCILNILKENEVLKSGEIYQKVENKLECNPRSCARYLTALVKRGILLREASGKNVKGQTMFYRINKNYKEDRKKCAICSFCFILDVHHIVPLSKGGSDDKSNKIYLCPNHHRMIHDLGYTIEDLKKFYNF